MRVLKKRKRDPGTTGWAVSSLGLLVSSLGARMMNKKVGAGILGFGLAHLVLGQLDRFRPAVKEKSDYF